MVTSVQPLVAIVTGASSGIGERFAWRLAQRRRHHLVIVARRRERLEQLQARIAQLWSETEGPSLSVQAFALDLARPLDRETLIAAATNAGWSVDVLVNNAGFGLLERFHESAFSDFTRMVELNCLAPLQLAHAFVPGMQARRRGTIINVASIGAFQPTPYMAVYGATKSFLLNLSLAMAIEYEPYGVKVVAHCPGPTDTEFHAIAGMPTPTGPLPVMSADAAVAECLNAVDHGRSLVINGPINRALLFLNRFVSVSRSARVAGAMMRSGLRNTKRPTE